MVCGVLPPTATSGNHHRTNGKPIVNICLILVRRNVTSHECRTQYHKDLEAATAIAPSKWQEVFITCPEPAEEHRVAAR